MGVFLFVMAAVTIVMGFVGLVAGHVPRADHIAVFQPFLHALTQMFGS